MFLTPTKILVIIAVVAVFLGYKKLPEMGKGLGEAIRNFRKGVAEPEEIDITPVEKKIDQPDERPEEPEARPEPEAKNPRRAYRAPSRTSAAAKKR